MYAMSIVFLLTGAVTLVIGFVQGGLTLIYISIGASAFALVLLIAGMLRRRPLQPATAGAPYGPAEGSAAAASTSTTQRPAARPPQRRPAATPPAGKPSEARRPDTTEEMPAPVAEEGAAEGTAAKKPASKKAAAKKPATKKAAAKKPAAKKTAAKKPAAKKAAAKKPAAKKTSARRSATGGQVVSLPERGTYHTAGCRFVKGKRDTEKITKATAKRRGYDACGVCKPDA